MSYPVGIGAIVGDVIGSPYEFDRNNIKTEDFPLFSPASHPTDDTVMTLAVGKALSQAKILGYDLEDTRKELIREMTTLGQNYMLAGYGARFFHWLTNPIPYESYGNGSAMRVSPVGWLYDSLAEVLEYARLTADVSHNHPEGVKGAQSVACAIFLTRNGMDKKELKEFIEKEFNYDLCRTLADIRPYYHHVESCQETVPEAIIAYLEGNSFIDVVRKAVSLGGDSDTLTAIAASIAEAKYGIPEEVIQNTLERLDSGLLEALKAYEKGLEEKF